MDHVKITRALLSVSDKTGLVVLGHALARHGVELLSTGGTAAALREAGLTVIDVADHTGFPEMMDGRVKTLHPKVHGGLLALRGDPGHAASMAEHDIAPIDLLVVNLYPFAATVARGAARDEVIENIDIGGPAMIRSAAKNHDFVVRSDRAQATMPALTPQARYGRRRGDRLANCAAPWLPTAFAAYRLLTMPTIAAWFARHRSGAGVPAGEDHLATRREVSRTLRYGENPHQQRGVLCRQIQTATRGIASAPRSMVQGKPLSASTTYNDADAAQSSWSSEFKDGPPTVAIIKHANPCGVASGATI